MNAPSVHHCFGDDELLELASGRLDPPAARRMVRELENCPDCALVLAEVGRLVAREAGDPIEESPGSWFGIAPGDVLGGRFRIVRALGAGGMGEVYEAIDVELGEPLALKTIRPGFAHKPSRVERFKQEVRLARRVQHPNVCRVLEFGKHQADAGSCYFLTMELLVGEPLSCRLRRAGRLPEQEVWRLAEHLCAGLGAIHAQGILHRDIKTNNVMVCSGTNGVERAVLLDFGVARQLEHHDSPLTGGGVIGTPEYMAPEQLRGGQLSAATDIYALGIVLYELLVGRLPFPPDGSLGPVLERLEARAPRPRALVPELSPALDELVAHCLEPRAEDRPRDVNALLQALETARRGHFVRPSQAAASAPTSEATPIVQGRAERRFGPRVAFVLGLIAACAGLVWLTRSNEAAPQTNLPAPALAPLAAEVAQRPVDSVVEPPRAAPAQPEATKPKPRVPAARKEPRSVTPEAPEPEPADCSPPYAYDERGLRVYKKQCL